MSLYEVLERFVGAGALACAGLVGAEMPAASPFDVPTLTTRLREQRQDEPFGTALDTLAHAVWFARERHGISLDTAERHASELAGLLSEVRIEPGAMAVAVKGSSADPDRGKPSHRVATLWLQRAQVAGALEKAGLDLEICRFLMMEMLALVIDQPRLLLGLSDVLKAHAVHQATLLPAVTAPLVAPPPAAASPVHAPAPAVSMPAVPTPAPLSAAATPSPLPPPVPQARNEPRGDAVFSLPPAAAPAALPDTAPVAAVVRMQTRPRLPDGALRRFQSILAQQPMSAEQRLARLEELGGWLTATVTQLRKPSNDAQDMRAAKLEAADALEAGDLERAMERLKDIREHMRGTRRRTEARIAEELQSLRQQMVEEAAATARLGELALARMELDTAADHFADAAGHLPANEPQLELEYRQRQAEALAAKAETTGDTRAVEAAAQAFRACRRIINDGTEARTKVRINVGLGDMLVALGARRANEAVELDEAVAAYADAIASIDRASKPMQWALVQLSLGAALIELGQRRDRSVHWKQAATALVPALEVFESRGASDLAEAAQSKLRAIAVGLAEPPAQGILARPLRSV